MPLPDRDYMKGEHPPACTCADCVNKRLKRLGINPRKHTQSPKDKRKFKFTYSHKKQKSVQRVQPEYHPPTWRLSTTDKKTRIKHDYPRHANIIANIILSFIVIFVIGLLGGGIYGISKYHSNVLNWVSQEYHSLANNVADFKDKTMNSLSDIANNASNSIQPTNNAPQSPTIIPSQITTPIIPATLTPIEPTIPQATPTIIQQQLQDPTWAQLVSFLQNDDTDQHPYIYPTFVCHNFSLMLQDHANKAGWRCAVVDVQLSGYPDWYNLGIPSNTGHNCNAFQTVDRGLIYIDCTGMQAGYPHPTRMVKTVDVQIGKHYIPVDLFPEAGWESAWGDMGMITGINSVQW